MSKEWLEGLVTYAQAQLTAREYDALYCRGVSDEQMIEYRIGCLRNELPEGCPDHFLKWARGKVNGVFVLPLTTMLGEIRGLQLRHIDRDIPGYSDYFLWKREACLFGLAQAAPHIWATRSVFIVEGAFDLFPIQRAAPMVIATLTARTSIQMVRVLKRLVDRVWIGYDMDKTGRAGCQDFAKRYGQDFDVEIVSYPDVNGQPVKDPGQFWEDTGDARVVPFVQGVIHASPIGGALQWRDYTTTLSG